MREYFSEKERESLRAMLCSRDLEQIKLALYFIENSPDYDKFKYGYPSIQYKQNIDELCRVSHYIMDEGLGIPYASTILSWALI